MNDVKWERYGAAAGLLFVILVLIATFLPGESPPAVDDAPIDIGKYFQGHGGAIQAGAFVIGLAAIAFLWFLGSLWSRVRRSEDMRRLATIAAGGGVASITLVLVGFSINATIALRLTNLGLPGVRLFYTLSNVVIAMASFSIAVLVIATSVAAMRAKVFPAWFGGAGAALGLLWVIAGLGVATVSSGIFVLGFVVFLLWLVWIVGISLFLLQAEEPVPSTA